jgi:hypothetical protein
MAFVPYLLFNNLFFFSSMNKRGYSVMWIWLGQILRLITFPVLMIAAVSALMGRKIAFGVTPKGKTPGGTVPVKRLWPQLVMLVLCAVSATVGVMKLLALFDYSVLVNVIWVAYYFAQLVLGLFLFNRPAAESYGDYMSFKAYESEPHGE